MARPIVAGEIRSMVSGSLQQGLMEGRFPGVMQEVLLVREGPTRQLLAIPLEGRIARDGETGSPLGWEADHTPFSRSGFF